MNRDELRTVIVEAYSGWTSLEDIAATVGKNIDYKVKLHNYTTYYYGN